MPICFDCHTETDDFVMQPRVMGWHRWKYPHECYNDVPVHVDRRMCRKITEAKKSNVGHEGESQAMNVDLFFIPISFGLLFLGLMVWVGIIDIKKKLDSIHDLLREEYGDLNGKNKL